ncbi:hypothetical protein GQ457_12G027470 [Hibiscus cannabinus]
MRGRTRENDEISQNQDMEMDHVARFLRDKTVLITGATGFLAKVFVEKILRLQPNVKKLYLLLRASDDKSATQRLHDEIISTELFRVLRDNWSWKFDNLISSKVIAVAGDISFDNLGIADSKLREKMWTEIEIVVNVAGTTDFRERTIDSVIISYGKGRLTCFPGNLNSALDVGVGNNDQKVLVLAATNTPYALDQAIRRRFDKRIYIPLPDLKARQHMFKVHLGDTPHNLTESDFENLARRTEGFSGSDISVKDVIFEPVRKTQDAMFFFKTPNDMWIPCGPKQSGAVQITMQELAAKGLAAQIHGVSYDSGVWFNSLKHCVIRTPWWKDVPLVEKPRSVGIDCTERNCSQVRIQELPSSVMSSSTNDGLQAVELQRTEVGLEQNEVTIDVQNREYVSGSHLPTEIGANEQSFEEDSGLPVEVRNDGRSLEIGSNLLASVDVNTRSSADVDLNMRNFAADVTSSVPHTKMPTAGQLGEILPPPISKSDFDKVLARQRPTVSKADLEVHERFTKEFGDEC